MRLNVSSAKYVRGNLGMLLLGGKGVGHDRSPHRKRSSSVPKTSVTLKQINIINLLSEKVTAYANGQA
jgi:hypothetical protein